MEMCTKMMEGIAKNEDETKTPWFLAFIPYIPLIVGVLSLVVGIMVNPASIKILWMVIAGIVTAIGVIAPIMIYKMINGMKKAFVSVQND